MMALAVDVNAAIIRWSMRKAGQNLNGLKLISDKI
jgi:hypothetical protein